MKREKIQTLNEKDLLIGLITSDRFCQEIIPVLVPRQLEIEYARIIAGWIKDYFNSYKVAPQKDIMKLYRAKADELNDESLQENILSFIKNLDENYDEKKISNVDFAINQSINYLKKRSLNNLIEDMSANLTVDDIGKVESLLTKYKCVEPTETSGVSLLHDSENIANSFLNENSLLYEINGAYGKVIGKIHREDFIAFLAPMKRGKTFHLLNVCVEAMKNGLKVLFISLEMSQEEIDLTHPKANEGGVGFHIQERNCLRDIKKCGLDDVFRKTHPNKQQFTWWDYRTKAFDRNIGWRLDYLLCSQNVINSAINCFVDLKTRSQQKTSDHAPLVLEFNI